MLKMALPDCAIDEKCCSVDGGRGRPSIFVPTLKDLTAQRSPPPGIYQSKKNANAYRHGGQHPREGELGAAGIDWSIARFFIESKVYKVLVLQRK